MFSRGCAVQLEGAQHAGGEINTLTIVDARGEQLGPCPDLAGDGQAGHAILGPLDVQAARAIDDHAPLYVDRTLGIGKRPMLGCIGGELAEHDG